MRDVSAPSGITVAAASLDALFAAAGAAAVNSAVLDFWEAGDPAVESCATDARHGKGMVLLIDPDGQEWWLCLACAIPAVCDRVQVPDSHTSVGFYC